MKGPVTGKRTVLLVGAVGIVLTLVSASQSWVSGTVRDALLAGSHLSVSGSKAAPVLVAAALVAAAGLLAAMTTGRIGRTISAGLVVVAGVAAAISAVVVLADPAAPVRSRAADLTGHTGQAQVTAHANLWPVAAMVGALLTFVAGVLAVVGARRWAGLSSRYDAPEARRARPVSDWDRLSLGEDPTTAPTARSDGDAAVHPTGDPTDEPGRSA